MTDVKLKCGAPECGYVTEKASVEIVWRLLQFHRQDNHVKQEVGDRERRQPGIKLKRGTPRCSYVTEEANMEIACTLLQLHDKNNTVQQGVGGGVGHQPRPSLDMDTTEGEWGIFEDCQV